MKPDKSPFLPGEQHEAVDLYQGLMGVEQTGVWTQEDEAEYAVYMARQTWEIFVKAMSSDGERILPNWQYT